MARIPEGECKDVPLKDTHKSKNGYAYEAAGAHIIVNEGNTDATFTSQEGSLGRMKRRTDKIIDKQEIEGE